MFSPKFRPPPCYDYAHPSWNSYPPGNWRSRRDARAVWRQSSISLNSGATSGSLRCTVPWSPRHPGAYRTHSVPRRVQKLILRLHFSCGTYFEAGGWAGGGAAGVFSYRRRPGCYSIHCSLTGVCRWHHQAIPAKTGCRQEFLTTRIDSHRSGTCHGGWLCQ